MQPAGLQDDACDQTVRVQMPHVRVLEATTPQVWWHPRCIDCYCTCVAVHGADCMIEARAHGDVVPTASTGPLTRRAWPHLITLAPASQGVDHSEHGDEVASDGRHQNCERPDLQNPEQSLWRCWAALLLCFAQ